MSKRRVCYGCGAEIPKGKGYLGTIQVLKKGNPFLKIVSRFVFCNDCGRIVADEVRKDAEENESRGRDLSPQPER